MEASLLDKSINFFKKTQTNKQKTTDPKLLNVSVYCSIMKFVILKKKSVKRLNTDSFTPSVTTRLPKVDSEVAH